MAPEGKNFRHMSIAKASPRAELASRLGGPCHGPHGEVRVARDGGRHHQVECPRGEHAPRDRPGTRRRPEIRRGFYRVKVKNERKHTNDFERDFSNPVVSFQTAIYGTVSGFNGPSHRKSRKEHALGLIDHVLGSLGWASSCSCLSRIASSPG